MKLNFGIKTVLAAIALQFICLNASAQEAEFDDVDCRVNGRYLEVTFDVELTNLRNKTVDIEVYFYDNSKRAIRSYSNSYSNNQNELMVSKSVRPSSYEEEYHNMTLRVPISEFSNNSSYSLYARPMATTNGKNIRSDRDYYSFRISNNNSYNNSNNSITDEAADGVFSLMGNSGGRDDITINDILDNDGNYVGDDYDYDDYDYDNDYSHSASNFTALKRKANNGDAKSQYQVGLCYEQGNGVAKSLYTAFDWYRKAANNRYLPAYYKLGECYYNGNGVTRNYKTAANWYEKAAKEGYTNAQYKLGKMYYEGEGVSRNYNKAAYWLEEAADGGNRNAERLLREIRY